MKQVYSSIIYENPLPQLRSRQAAFPWLCEASDGTVIASFSIGEAFESVDSTSFISKSNDGGKTWSNPIKMFDKSELNIPIIAKSQHWTTAELSRLVMHIKEIILSYLSEILQRAVCLMILFFIRHLTTTAKVGVI